MVVETAFSIDAPFERRFQAGEVLALPRRLVAHRARRAVEDHFLHVGDNRPVGKPEDRDRVLPDDGSWRTRRPCPFIDLAIESMTSPYPYVHTQAGAKGAGPGLAIRRQIVRRSGGSRTLEPRDGAGACARAALPLHR